MKIFLILILSFALKLNSYCQTTDTIYSYIGKFTIDTAGNITPEEIKCLNENFRRFSYIYFYKCFTEATKDESIKYKLIDVENEDEAIKQREYNKKNNIPLATADYYMVGTISKTMNYFLVSVKVKKFDNTFIAISNFHALKFSACDDDSVIYKCLNSVALDIALQLNPKCPKKIFITTCNDNNLKDINKKIEKLNKLIIKYDDKLFTELYQFFSSLEKKPDEFCDLPVTVFTLQGRWNQKIMGNCENALKYYQKALNLFCGQISTCDYDILFEKIAGNQDIKIWINQKISECDK
jgi:hypothetical protein